MMTKKLYQQFANALAKISNIEEREKVISFLIPIFREDNWRFDSNRFREWIRRVANGESTKGLG